MERRFTEGFANPKKDWWARRKFRHLIEPEEYGEIAEVVEVGVSKLTWWQRFIKWFKSLWHKNS